MDFLTKDFFARALIAKGRSTRKSYWLTTLVISIIVMAAQPVLITMLGLKIGLILYLILVLIITIPHTMIAIRRLHDTGRSGWHLLWYFTVIGILWVLYLLIAKGDEGANAHGDPSDIS
jgi:uncharacterized membrane protein YhaH (DUF805 family)